MSGSTLIALPHAGEMTLWRLVEAGQPHPSRLVSRRAVAVFCLGLVLTGGGVAATWTALQPDTVVQTRILADGGSGGAALSDVALRLAVAPGQPVSLQEGGQALVVTVQDRDPAQAEQRSHSLVDAILNAPVLTPPVHADPLPAGPAPGLRAERDRIAASIAALDAQEAATSASLTTLARDMASANRAPDPKPGHETLDKGNAALADLQLQRLQLVSKYQDTYPAVIALDGQIRNLRVFLMDEAQRVQPRPVSTEPTNSVLTTERDRLRAELAQFDERRRALATRLADVDHRVAAMPASLQAPAVAVTAMPMLIAAATSNFNAGAAKRPMIAPIVGAVGLLLSGLAALLVGRGRSEARGRGLMLEPVPGGMLAAAHARSLPPPGFPSLADSGAVQLHDWRRS